MSLPKWMDGFPGAPRPALPDREVDSPIDEPVGLTACTCRGEGCQVCDGDGVIYP